MSILAITLSLAIKKKSIYIRKVVFDKKKKRKIVLAITLSGESLNPLALINNYKQIKIEGGEHITVLLIPKIINTSIFFLLLLFYVLESKKCLLNFISTVQTLFSKLYIISWWTRIWCTNSILDADRNKWSVAGNCSSIC